MSHQPTKPARHARPDTGAAPSSQLRRRHPLRIVCTLCILFCLLAVLALAAFLLLKASSPTTPASSQNGAQTSAALPTPALAQPDDAGAQTPRSLNIATPAFDSKANGEIPGFSFSYPSSWQAVLTGSAKSDSYKIGFTSPSGKHAAFTVNALQGDYSLTHTSNSGRRDYEEVRATSLNLDGRQVVVAHALDIQGQGGGIEGADYPSLLASVDLGQTSDYICGVDFADSDLEFTCTDAFSGKSERKQLIKIMASIKEVPSD